MAFPPRFPVVPSYLPHSLNPLNLNHQLLLLYWVYCCPSHLRIYLYQINPERYKTASGLDILHTFRQTPYQNLYCCVPLSVILLSTALSLPILWLWKGTAIDWGQWLLGLGLGNLVGLVFGGVFALTFGLASGSAKGIAWGVTIGLITGVSNASGLAILLGALPVDSFAQILDLNSLGVTH